MRRWEIKNLGDKELKPTWVSKTDPEHHPVRFLASVWNQRMKERFGIQTSFGGKEFGQLRNLMNALGDLTPDVIEWMLDPSNWWFFCQQVQSELKVRFVRDYPEVGFLLLYRGVALRLMHTKLQNSPEHADFIGRLEKRWNEAEKKLSLAYAMIDKLSKLDDPAA